MIAICGEHTSMPKVQRTKKAKPFSARSSLPTLTNWRMYRMIVMLVCVACVKSTARHVSQHSDVVPDPLQLNQTVMQGLTDPLEYRLFVKLDSIKKDLLAWQETKFLPDEYSAENDMIVEMVRVEHSVSQEQTLGCCAIWKYHKCIVSTLRPFARFRDCTESMIIQAEADMDDIVRRQMKDALICPDYYLERQLCEGLFGLNTPYVLGLRIILALGFVALICCGMLVALSFYRFAATPSYIVMSNRRGPGDMVELMEK